jgi:DNA adenine methylase
MSALETLPADPVTAPALRYHGAKFRLAQWVMQFFPAHTCYVEPFGGAAGVLLQKERVYAEVYNDLDGAVVNFFRVLRDPALRIQLLELLVLTPYSRADFEQAWEPTEDALELARRLCIRAQMGFGSAGATKGHTGFRIDTKREYGTAQHLWSTYPHAVAAAGQRMTGVLVENRPAIDVMQAHDAPTTLHFVDPPYMHETRVMTGSRRTYKHELSNVDHVELLDALLELEGFVVLSGYRSDLYSEKLAGWTQHTTSARISAGRGTALREEVIWINPACAATLEQNAAQQRMFA